MSTKIIWSAFIYTRTYSVDYRTIVIPDDFNKEKKKWVNDHITELKTAIAVQYFSPPVELLQRVFLSDRQHYIFGILCNLRKLLNENERRDLAKTYLSQTNEKAKDLSVDKNPSLIPFTFLGYVIERSSHLPELPPIRFDLDIFKPLCQFICHKWLEETQSPPTLLRYKVEESPEWLFESCPKVDSLPSLNTEHQKLALHPGGESYTQQLWTAAALCDKPQTLWIGQIPGNQNPESILVSSFPEKRNLLESRFLNIALPNIDTLKIYSKQTQGSIEIIPAVPDPQPTHDGNPFNFNFIREIEKLKNNIPNFGILKELQERMEKIEIKVRELQERMENTEIEIRELQNENRKKDDKIAELESQVSELKDILKNHEEIRNQE